MISIVVPAYNAEKFIKKCIKSVIEQKFDDYELIIINDCSTDNTIKIIQEYADKCERIKVYSNEKNMGEGNTRNVGINNAIGEYIMFLDSDDYLFNDSLNYINDMIKKYDFDIMTFPLSTSENISSKHNEKLYTGDKAFSMFLCYRKMSGYAGGKVLKRSLIGDNRFEQLRIGADGDFMIRMFSKSQKVLYSTKNIYYYRVYDESASERNVFSDKMLDGVKRLPVMREKLFSSPELEKYEDLYSVFEFRTLFARIDKMIKTNSVEKFEKDFYSIIDKMKKIQFKFLFKSLRWNIKNPLFLIKFWIICFKYNR